jgi:hypothetical protein
LAEEWSCKCAAPCEIRYFAIAIAWSSGTSSILLPSDSCAAVTGVAFESNARARQWANGLRIDQITELRSMLWIERTGHLKF